MLGTVCDCTIQKDVTVILRELIDLFPNLSGGLLLAT